MVFEEWNTIESLIERKRNNSIQGRKQMRLCMRFELVRDKFCESIFPRTEKIAEEYSIPLIKDCYRSVMDMIFCSFYPEYKPSCMEYYENDDTPQLKDILTKKQIREYDSAMVIQILSMAYELANGE